MKNINIKLIKPVIFSALTVVMAIVIFTACRHNLEKEGIYGPEYASAPGDFYVVNNEFKADPSSVNFQISKDTFKAEFSHKVTWTITITGQKSGAVKILKGTSTSLNGLNALWDGTTDNNIFFQNEACNVVISFLGSATTLSTTVTITKIKLHGGLLVSDFEALTMVSGKWYDYSDTLKPQMVKEISSFNDLASSIPTVQGKRYLHIAGTDLDQDWYIGGCGFWDEAPGTPGAVDLGPKLAQFSDNPQELYFNAFINSNGKKNTSVSIALIEYRGSQASPIPGDVFSTVVPITWDGWKLVSIKLSQFARAVSSTGDGVLKPSDLRTIEFVPSPTALGAEVELNVDYIIFTKDKPFQP
ncbi:MAG: hypothetical protein ACK40G_09345 [Cytophagaceae bacterium]